MAAKKTRKGRYIFDNKLAKQLGVYEQLSEKVSGLYRTMSAKDVRQKLSDELSIDISERWLYRMAREKLGENEYNRITEERNLFSYLTDMGLAA